MREVRFIVAAAVFVFFMGVYQAEGVYDHFNDGSLDSAWQVSYENAAGWNYQESGTNLTVSGVTGAGTGWNRVCLKQNFAAAGDFSVSSAMSWDSIHGNSDMQLFTVRLYHGGQSVISCAYSDPWVTHSAQQTAFIEGKDYTSGWNTLPYTGNATIEIERINGFTTISWNGDTLNTGSSSSVIDQIGLEFWGSQWDGYSFGSLSADYVSAVPEPGTILLFGFGSMILAGRRRR